MWLVVDTNVLVDASGQGIPHHAEDSYILLGRLLDRREFRLALDRKQKILAEYTNRICAPMFGHHWLEALQRRQLIQAVAGTGIPRGASVELQECHFDKADRPLVEAAYHSCKIIVTRDFNSFTLEVIQVLRRRLDIRVYSASEMLARLDT